MGLGQTFSFVEGLKIELLGIIKWMEGAVWFH